jgi:hypothetical protein
LFTGIAALRTALAYATVYARSLDAHFTVIATHVVPYPLPLSRPSSSSAKVLEQRLAAVAAEQRIDTSVQIYICRDPQQTIREVLQPEAATVVAGRKRWWWPTREQRLASRLRRDGHNVIFMDTKPA